MLVALERSGEIAQASAGHGRRLPTGAARMTELRSAVVNALSIDVEEYYHATIFQEAVNGVTTGLRSRVEASTDRVLALLRAARVKGTFFVLGEVASEHPAIVRRIAEEGHEIACHGYHHTLVSGQSPEEFRMGIRRAKAVLEDVGGHPVIGYRAPSFSIGPSERWALCHPGRGRLPLRLQRLSDPPRSLRRSDRALVSPMRSGEKDVRG